jgi:hypothetical protein
MTITFSGGLLIMSTSWSDWRVYFIKLGNNVKDHGWIFVSVLGYPLFYYDQGSGMICVWGVNTFLSVVPGLSVECKLVMAGDPAYPSHLTETGQEAATYMGTTLPSETITIRPHRWSVDPNYVFYMQIDDPWTAEGFKYGASAVSMGKGFFILNGFGDGRLEPEVPLATNKTVGEAAAAFSAYILGKPVSIVTATIDIKPNMLNLQSKGKWITTYIELPDGYSVADINRTTILLNGTIPVDLFWISKPIKSIIGDYDNDTIPDLMIKFDRQQVINYIMANVDMSRLYEERFMTITLTVTGKLKNGTPFQGSDTVKIILLMPRGIYKIFPI